MLKRLKVHGFKSLDGGEGVEVRFPRLTVLFGPNAAGKSNLLDAIQALSRIGTSRTIADALSEPIRGYPIESFAFPPGGLPALLDSPHARFSLEADLDAGKDSYRYRIEVEIEPKSGSLSVQDEYLATLSAKNEPKGMAAIELVSEKLRLRRKSHPGKPRSEPLGQNYTMLSDPRLGGSEYRAIERTRTELSGWRTYYLDPRVAMRAARPPAEVDDIGVLGGDIAPFLFRLRAKHPKHYEAIRRTLRTVIPGVEGLEVDLDERRGTLDILVRQDGTDFSSRIVSEGTLRVLAICAMAVNPWSGSLLAFEEPENGVHPRRLKLIAQLLSATAGREDRQVIVTTHSAAFCEAVMRIHRETPQVVSLLRVERSHGGTVVRHLDIQDPVLWPSTEKEIGRALTAEAEDGVLLEGLLLRGLLDG
jgi:predicted ATPase